MSRSAPLPGTARSAACGVTSHTRRGPAAGDGRCAGPQKTRAPAAPATAGPTGQSPPQSTSERPPPTLGAGATIAIQQDSLSRLPTDIKCNNPSMLQSLPSFHACTTSSA
ncbi:hypothetical protein E2C01_041821 [Portunus trituberculatus]|uniref:Uncharacterized protein n=1 Tax=Portunus trituberculatus TaxID=210409 RepID=A0A5B7FRE2_PORTR|nr:hypothetical protein [Portunus trituberculatus]